MIVSLEGSPAAGGAWHAAAWLRPRSARSGQSAHGKGFEGVHLAQYYGVTYRHPRTQELIGIDIELAAALATDLNVRVEYVDSSFPTLVSDLVEDRCDVAMFAVGVTAQRAEKLRFTQPYLRSDIYGITTKSNQVCARMVGY